MEEPAHDPPDDGLGTFPVFPAPGRPEQPMTQKQSSWPWVLGAAILSLTVILGLLVVVVAYVLNGLSNQ